MSLLLESLLDLQTTLSAQHKDGSQQQTPMKSSDEDIPSDNDEDDREGETVSLPRLKGAGSRKRLAGDWGTKRDYSAEIARGHEGLRSYRDEVISRWNEKIKLASGKITSKVVKMS